MTLRTATQIKTVSDSNQPAASVLLDTGAVGSAIDAAADTAALLGEDRAALDLNALINEIESTVEIIQAGGNLNLDDVLLALVEKGFRASARAKKAREGGQDRVTLTIAWNAL